MVRESVDDVLWVADGRAVRGTTVRLLDPSNLERLYAASAGEPAPARGEAAG
jgi:hypothetical protein